MTEAVWGRPHILEMSFILKQDRIKTETMSNASKKLTLHCKGIEAKIRPVQIELCSCLMKDDSATRMLLRSIAQAGPELF